MRTIHEMRAKYWSGMETLWPAKRSKVAVPFCWEGLSIDWASYHLARIYTNHGRWNDANYHLTAAYKGGQENDAFWNQFT